MKNKDTVIDAHEAIRVWRDNQIKKLDDYVDGCRAQVNLIEVQIAELANNKEQLETAMAETLCVLGKIKDFGCSQGIEPYVGLRNKVWP